MNTHTQIAALRNLGAQYDPDNTTTATGDYDGPGEPCIAGLDLLAMADEAEARESRWLGR